MALNIKSLEVEQMAAETARLTGESKTEAIRVALKERLAKLKMRGGSLAAHRSQKLRVALRL